MYFCSMTPREKEILTLIEDRIKRKDPSAQIVLFGSHATGNATENSDWDLLILISAPKTTREIEKIYRDELFEIELEIEEPISSIIFNQKDWESRFSSTPLYLNIKKEGIYLA